MEGRVWPFSACEKTPVDREVVRYPAWAMATITLRIEYPNREPENRQLIGEHFSIGRDAGDLALHEALVSSSHGELVVDEQQRCVVYTDLGSSNGTYRPTGERLEQPTTLGEGEAIYIGGCTITICAIAFATPEPLQAPARGGTFVGEAEAPLERTSSGTIITAQKAGEPPPEEPAAEPVQPAVASQPSFQPIYASAPAQPLGQAPSGPQLQPSHHSAGQAVAHAPQQPQQSQQPQQPQQPQHQASMHAVAQPSSPQAPGYDAPVQHVHTPNPAEQPAQHRQPGQWYEAATGPGDPHQQTFVMGLSSGHVVIRTRTQGQAGPLETMVAVPGSLSDFNLL